MTARLPESETALITVAEACRITGMSDSWVRRAVRRGALVGYKFGRRALRISRDSVDDLLERHRVGTDCPTGRPADGGRKQRRARDAAYRRAVRKLAELGI